MFSPRASSTYSSAKSAMRTQKLPADCRMKGRISSPMALNTTMRMRSRRSFGFMLALIRFSSGAVRHPLAEQPRGPQREHDDQHDEGEDVAVLAAQHAAGDDADVARADGLDQSEQDAADHRARQVADAAEHRRGEGLQSRQEAHGVLHAAVV